MTNGDAPMQAFSSAEKFAEWLDKNHDQSDGIWLRFYKKASGVPTVVYSEAVDVALCYGWIDSQMKSLDEQSYIQKFTPRRAKSMWSKVNIEKVERLIKEGKMSAAGLAQIEAAKADGRWDKAYHSQSTFVMDEDFLRALTKQPKAQAFYDSLTKANKYAIYFRIHHTKPEKRSAKISEMVAMLEAGKAIHLI